MTSVCFENSGNVSPDNTKVMHSLDEEELRMAETIYQRLETKIRNLRRGSRDFWATVADMQYLANLGYAHAAQYMNRIDLAKAPDQLNHRMTQSWDTRPASGVAFKGKRRQLHADPTSPNKTFGMRPLWARQSDELAF